MRSFRRDRLFDRLDLEIIGRAYEAAWARVETDIFRDIAKDDERKTALRQWTFILAGSHPVDFDTLYEKLESVIPKPWITAPTRTRPYKSAHSCATPLISHRSEEVERRAT
jgi:hypothetical protein